MNCLSETPLHVAVMLGHVDFVKEILCRKPELADELDSRRSVALHMASQKGYVDIVQALLQANPEMCFARDVDGRNPLHLAAMKGRIDVLGELLNARPCAASASTIWGETILHLCVKHNQLEVLKFLLETMDDPEFFNAKDDYGMTILHVAVADKRIEVIKFLTTRTKINVNALNANGFTAWDILAQSKRDVKDWEIGESLRHAGAISAKDNNDIHLSVQELGTRQTNILTSSENNQEQRGKASENFPEKEYDWLDKKRNALMVGSITHCYHGLPSRCKPSSKSSARHFFSR
ncbi:Ankyrin repeat family protein [Melia azedarach]|uniref:Ankyrin repeat family protein n=1 Tax=Melia azedarach TaxID=155640 RepID=A0ACC1Y3J9_MELAZ|nr:Ankyrin repeat family protein [Melia azedarach]